VATEVPEGHFENLWFSACVHSMFDDTYDGAAVVSKSLSLEETVRTVRVAPNPGETTYL